MSDETPTSDTTKLDLPPVVSADEWLAARKDLLVKEKALTKARDELNTARRQLPMVEVTKEYELHSEHGPVRLIDLFEERDQLIVHHFMWTYDIDEDSTEHPRDEGCPSCSATADDIGNLSGLWVRGATLAAVSRAPIDKISAFKRRMGWTFPWYSSAGSDFNYDFHVTIDDRVAPVLLNFRNEAELAENGTPWSTTMRGDWPGVSAFLRQGDRVFHTYSTFARGIEQQSSVSTYLDLTVLGRQESWEQPPGRITGRGAGAGSAGLKLHDQYTAQELGLDRT
jgi:predicted dithiol-disulfide oxidoreductase (DUF899 family)